MITALAGGIGAARFLRGLVKEIPAAEVAVIDNTGDDLWLHGLRVCPDLDTVLYTLTGRVNPDTGWGVERDTFHCLEQLGELGAETWFRLGDRDLAVHLFRTEKLGGGWTLARVTRSLCEAFGLAARLLPMCEGYHPTLVKTPQGRLHLQEYFVRERCRPRVEGFVYSGLEEAALEPEVAAALELSEMVILCPSNPFISLAPILEVPGLRGRLREHPRVVAITPLIGGRAVKGPAARMLADLGLEVSAAGVAKLYRGLVNRFVLDRRDAALAGQIETLEMEVQVADTLMSDDAASRRLAAAVLEGP